MKTPVSSPWRTFPLLRVGTGLVRILPSDSLVGADEYETESSAGVFLFRLDAAPHLPFPVDPLSPLPPPARRASHCVLYASSVEVVPDRELAALVAEAKATRTAPNVVPASAWDTEACAWVSALVGPVAWPPLDCRTTLVHEGLHTASARVRPRIVQSRLDAFVAPPPPSPAATESQPPPASPSLSPSLSPSAAERVPSSRKRRRNALDRLRRERQQRNAAKRRKPATGVVRPQPADESSGDATSDDDEGARFDRVAAPITSFFTRLS